MKFGRSLLGIGDGLVDRILCVIGTVAFAQVPEFIQQYLQRLGGHLDEARRQLERFRDVARQSGLTLEGLISRTDANTDPAVARLGGVMHEAIARVAQLEQAQAALQHAAVWERPFVFLQHLETDIARGTWAIFRPAIPTTLEGAAYAMIGMLILLTAYHVGLKYSIGRIRRALRARRTRSATTTD